MQAQLCCIGIDDGRTFNVSDPPPDILRIPRTVVPTFKELADKDTESSYDEYERDGVTAGGLVRYVKSKHD